MKTKVQAPPAQSAGINVGQPYTRDGVLVVDLLETIPMSSLQDVIRARYGVGGEAGERMIARGSNVDRPPRERKGGRPAGSFNLKPVDGLSWVRYLTPRTEGCLYRGKEVVSTAHAENGVVIVDGIMCEGKPIARPENPIAGSWKGSCRSSWLAFVFTIGASTKNPDDAAMDGNKLWMDGTEIFLKGKMIADTREKTGKAFWAKNKDKYLVRATAANGQNGQTSESETAKPTEMSEGKQSETETATETATAKKPSRTAAATAASAAKRRKAASASA